MIKLFNSFKYVKELKNEIDSLKELLENYKKLNELRKDIIENQNEIIEVLKIRNRRATDD